MGEIDSDYSLPSFMLRAAKEAKKAKQAAKKPAAPSAKVSFVIWSQTLLFDEADVFLWGLF